MKIKPIYYINAHRNGFYPFYGGSSIKRHTNSYRNGETKGSNRKETRPQRDSRLSNILSSHKREHKNLLK